MRERFFVEDRGVFQPDYVAGVRVYGEWALEFTAKRVERPRQLALGVAVHAWEPWGTSYGPLTGVMVRVWMFTVSAGIRAPRTAAQLAEVASWDDDDDEEAP